MALLARRSASPSFTIRPNCRLKDNYIRRSGPYSILERIWRRNSWTFQKRRLSRILSCQTISTSILPTETLIEFLQCRRLPNWRICYPQASLGKDWMCRIVCHTPWSIDSWACKVALGSSNSAIGSHYCHNWSNYLYSIEVLFSIWELFQYPSKCTGVGSCK